MTFERMLQEMEEAKKAAAEEAARVAAEKKKEKEKKEAAAAAAKQANAAAAAAAQQQAAAAAQQPPDYAAGLNAAPATPAAAVNVTPAYAPPTPTPLQVTALSVMSIQFSIPYHWTGLGKRHFWETACLSNFPRIVGTYYVIKRKESRISGIVNIRSAYFLN